MKSDYPIQNPRNPGDESNLPSIVVNDRQLRDVLDAAWAAIHASNDPPQLFRYEGKLVRIIKTEGHPTIRLVNSNAMIAFLAEAANWFYQAARGKAPIHPPNSIARLMAALPDPNLPILKAVSGAGSSGLLGYQPDTQLYLYPDRDPNMESE